MCSGIRIRFYFFSPVQSGRCCLPLPPPLLLLLLLLWHATSKPTYPLEPERKQQKQRRQPASISRREPSSVQVTKERKHGLTKTYTRTHIHRHTHTHTEFTTTSTIFLTIKCISYLQLMSNLLNLSLNTSKNKRYLHIILLSTINLHAFVFRKCNHWISSSIT